MKTLSEKKYTCIVSWNGWDWQDSYTVKSPSGKIKTAKIYRLPKGYGSLSEKELALLNKLNQHGELKWNEPIPMELTREEMEDFLMIVKKCNK